MTSCGPAGSGEIIVKSMHVQSPSACAVSIVAAFTAAVCEIADAIRSCRVNRMIKYYEESDAPGYDPDFESVMDDDDEELDGEDVEIGPDGMIFGEKS